MFPIRSCPLRTILYYPHGGLRWYYSMEKGNHAEEAVAAFHALGAEKISAWLAQANASFPGGQPLTDRGLRLDQMRDLDDENWRQIHDGVAMIWEEDIPLLLAVFMEDEKALRH